MSTDPIAPAVAATRTTYMRWGAFALMLLLVPSASDSQARRSCPRYARVPGYGACTNIGGIDCGFCTYKCNDDTVVRWNVCQQ